MNVELATMIQTVSVWAVFCLIVYLLSAIVGVSGNQLNRVKLRLDKINKSRQNRSGKRTKGERYKKA